MDDAFYRKQRELMTQVIAESDVVITTAAVPGKRAPVLITSDMARQMDMARLREAPIELHPVTARWLSANPDGDTP